MQHLDAEQLNKLFSDVFPPLQAEEKMVILVDIPNNSGDDHTDWRQRRRLAYDWSQKLTSHPVVLAAYAAVDANNADLPAEMVLLSGQPPDTADRLSESGRVLATEKLFTENQLFIALTQFSATAPLKIAAARHAFRAATMPGFSADMIPALKLDYQKISHRVTVLKNLLDEASGVQVLFQVKDEEHGMFFDLDHRTAHASSGRFPKQGMAGNLPSGEAYIVPYEGEKGPHSRTRGVLPVQFEDIVVLYEIRNNRAVFVHSKGKISTRELALLLGEPAYGNMAELGFGVLAGFGITPIGQVLLDEKLGFHVAFGRSNHFGGIVGPENFSSPQAVVHIDRIYIPQVQPKVLVKSVSCEFSGRPPMEIMQNGSYCLPEFQNGPFRQK